ncbi:conserved hypothetical protein [Pseudomonas sp. IT-P44]
MPGSEVSPQGIAGTLTLDAGGQQRITVVNWNAIVGAGLLAIAVVQSTHLSPERTLSPASRLLQEFV